MIQEPRILDPIYHMPKSTTKQKEPKMTQKKPTTKKPKYPAPREAVTYGCAVQGKEPKELIKSMLDLTVEIHNGTLKDLAATGTKLDRALVDLKVAKARIKELEAAK